MPIFVKKKIMKKLLAFVALFLVLQVVVKAQSNGLYIVAIRQTSSTPGTFLDSVFVSNPSGVVTSFALPFRGDAVAYYGQLNVILNNITNQGYKFLGDPGTAVDILNPSMTPTISAVTERWIFGMP